MAEYEIRITGVHYGANGDSVAGQKDTSVTGDEVNPESWTQLNGSLQGLSLVTLILTHVEGEVLKILKLTGFNKLLDIR